MCGSIGESFESFVINSIIESLPNYNPNFYKSSDGAEIDLVLEKGQQKICIEIKASMTPKLSQGFYESIKFLNPTKSYVVANIKESFPIKGNIMATPLSELLKELQK